jgi:8-oxo-dGTP pyrophosphatase MutT (NUDIX family)
MSTTSIRRRAAAVVYRTDRGRVEYLVVSASKDRSRFVLPAGHIEAGESPATTAFRETYEEAGVLVDIEHRLGSYVHAKPSGKLRPTEVFLASYDQDTFPRERRVVRWLPYADVRLSLHRMNPAVLDLIDRAHFSLTARRAA